MSISKPSSILRGVFIGLILLGILDLASANPARGGSAKEAGSPEALLPQQTPSASTTTQVFLPLATHMGFNPPVEILASWIENQDGDPKTIFLPYDQVDYKVTIANNTNSAQSAMVRWTQTGPCGEIVLKEQTLMLGSGVSSNILVPDAPIPDCQGVHTNLIEVIYEEDTVPDAFLHIVTSEFQSFDMCSLPTATQMQAWWNESPYYTINLYIGGISVACKPPNLNQTWLSQVTPQGWTYTLTWVGPQAPCTNFKYPMSGSAATAKLQGRTEADMAVAAAKGLGFTSDKAIYYDLEGYSNQATTACKAAVDSFMQGWVERIHELGFKAGAYGGACSSFMADWWDNNPRPDNVWLAHWYVSPFYYAKYAHVWNTPCVGNSLWPDHQRLKQYAGDHQETWGGAGPFTIDSNVLDGEVATFQAAPSTLSAVPDSLHAAPSSPAETQELSAMGLLSPEQGWVFRSGQLFHTQDGGEAWLDITPKDIGAGDILGITFLDSPQTARGWVVGRSIVEGGASLSVLRTSDAGQNWTAALLPVSPEEAISIETAYLDFIDPQTGWVAVKLHSGNNFSLGRSFATLDGGQTWEERSLPLGEPVRFIDPLRGWIAGGPSGDQLYRTLDGGLTWEAQSLPIPESLDFEALFVGLPEFATSLSGILPVTFSGGPSPRLVLFETADGGQTWILERVIGLGSSSQQPGGKIPFSGSPGAPGEWWAAAPGEGLLVSADPAGKPVTLAASGLSGAIVEIDFTSSGTGWAIVQEGTCQGTKTPAGQTAPAGSEPWRCELVSRLMVTEDGGISWREVTPQD